MVAKSAPVGLSNATPQADGVPTAGSAQEASRADHVHAGAAGASPSDATPIIAGTGAAGSSALYARGDHVHPAQSVPSASGATPLVASGSGAVGSSGAFARGDHVHPAQSQSVPSVTPSTSSRVLGTAFQPSATSAVFCSYTVRATVTNPLLAGSSSAIVTLLSDASNPPTTERARVEAISSVGLAVAVALTTTNTAPLGYMVPAGHYVRLVGSTSGTGSTALAAQVEEVIS